MKNSKNYFLQIKSLIDKKKFLELKKFCEDELNVSDDKILHNYLGIANLNLKNFEKAEKSFDKTLEYANLKDKISVKKNLYVCKYYLKKYLDCELIFQENILDFLHNSYFLEIYIKCLTNTKNDGYNLIVSETVKIKLINQKNYLLVEQILNNLLLFQLEDLVFDYLKEIEADSKNHLDSFQNSILAIFYFKIQKFLECKISLNKKPILLSNQIKFSLLGEISRYENKKISAFKYYLKYYNLTGDTGSLMAITAMFKFKKNTYKILQIFKNTNPDKLNQVQLAKFLFAKSKIEEDKKNFVESQNFFMQANKLRKKDIVYNNTNISDELSFYRKKFDKKFFLKFKNVHQSEYKPIFILGLPRSGSTLVEQILSSHPDINGYGELKIFNSNLKYLFNTFVKSDLEIDIDNLSIHKIKKLSNLYFKKVCKYNNSNRKIFTDKMPFNFYFIGLIKTIFSNSKILVTKRSLKDNFISILKNYFYDDLLNFAYDEEDIINYFKLYIEHVNFYFKEFEEQIYSVDYQKLVNEPKEEVKKLLKYCEVDWNDNCLKFYQNKKMVTTLSANQVREKIYKSSSNYYKNFSFEESYKKIDELAKKIIF